MGLYINIEMPKSCPICIVIDTAGQARHYDLNNDRYADDKLFEAITVAPHGRLGDLDVLYSEMEKYSDYGGAKEYHDDEMIHRDSILYAIEQIPTIIPAEEEET